MRENTMVTEYQLNRRRRMNSYLNSLKDEAKRINGDESVIWLAEDLITLLIHKIAQQGKVLEIPDCCPSESNEGDFHVMFAWDKDEHYLECEIYNTGLIEFFYRNRLTNKTWSWETIYALFSDTGVHVQALCSNELIEKLSLFTE
jgi:hypothetical protein